MKSVLKQMLMTVAAITVIAPAFAAEPRMPTKGTKFYQSSKSTDAQTSGQDQAAAQPPSDVQDIAPAAGATEEKADTGRSLREEMRLPRKN